MTKTFVKAAAQGDIYVRRVRGVPKKATRRMAPVDGRVIVAHSETGHHHSLIASAVEGWEDPADPMVCYLRVTSPSALLEHQRPWDTHETLALQQGRVYEIRRQEELTPEGWVRVAD